MFSSITIISTPPPHPLLVLKKTHNIRSIATKLRPSIQQQIQLPMQRLRILQIMQCSGRSPTRNNRMIRLLSRSVRNTLLNKKPLQLPFILRMLHSLQNSRVSNSTYRIRLPRQRNLIFIFNSSTFFNSLLEEGEIFFVEFEEGDVRGDLVGDGPYRRACSFMCEEGSYFIGGTDVVYVVF